MGLSGPSTGRALRLEDVTGSLDLQREREAAKALGMRVVGIRVERTGELPIDGEQIARTTSPLHRGNRMGAIDAVSNLLFKRAWPSPPAWAQRPSQFSAYPPEWERGLLRFAVAFEGKVACERSALVALRLPVPKQVSRYVIEPVGVEAWITYAGQFRFSSLDVTPPRFEISPNVVFVSNPETSPVTGQRSGAGYIGSFATSLHGSSIEGPSDEARARRDGDDSSRPETDKKWVSRDPYAFYRLLSGRGYVYHLYEGGLEADFDKYWLTKFEPAVERMLPRPVGSRADAASRNQ